MQGKPNPLQCPQASSRISAPNSILSKPRPRGQPVSESAVWPHAPRQPLCALTSTALKRGDEHPTLDAGCELGGQGRPHGGLVGVARRCFAQTGSKRGEEITGREGWQHSPVGSGVGGRAAKAPLSSTDESAVRSAFQVPDDKITFNRARKAAQPVRPPLDPRVLAGSTDTREQDRGEKRPQLK
ncbi:unnamed protein product [Rangifer tarandus platyrhynchus]|uniref:Uncharacterized protein n=2 Tax=Rangifer tarandus platyrhynchus TaxID=3082113 RepID=A0ABN8Z522_RANTA|nr:unnamed protein product [Rangifer tarandus platyrhynchus]CAI9704053.1 unnamed protein product [Rangifer tarandus platyrhynchus]